MTVAIWVMTEKLSLVDHYAGSVSPLLFESL